MKIEIKESAIQNNQAVEEYVADNSEMITVASVEDAEALATRLSEVGEGPVSLQSTAPQDSTTADIRAVRMIDNFHRGRIMPR